MEVRVRTVASLRCLSVAPRVVTSAALRCHWPRDVSLCLNRSWRRRRWRASCERTGRTTHPRRSRWGGAAVVAVLVAVVVLLLLLLILAVAVFGSVAATVTIPRVSCPTHCTRSERVGCQPAGGVRVGALHMHAVPTTAVSPRPLALPRGPPALLYIRLGVRAGRRRRVSIGVSIGISVSVSVSEAIASTWRWWWWWRWW
jgi:hypothetical protein